MLWDWDVTGHGDYRKNGSFLQATKLKADSSTDAYPRHINGTWPPNLQHLFCVLQQFGAM